MTNDIDNIQKIIWQRKKWLDELPSFAIATDSQNGKNTPAARAALFDQMGKFVGFVENGESFDPLTNTTYWGAPGPGRKLVAYRHNPTMYWHDLQQIDRKFAVSGYEDEEVKIDGRYLVYEEFVREYMPEKLKQTK